MEKEQTSNSQGGVLVVLRSGTCKFACLIIVAGNSQQRAQGILGPAPPFLLLLATNDLHIPARGQSVMTQVGKPEGSFRISSPSAWEIGF